MQGLGEGDLSALKGYGAIGMDRGVTQSDSEVFVLMLDAETRLALVALDIATGEHLWDLAVPNIGEVEPCGDCTPDQATATAIVWAEDRACLSGRLIGEGTVPQGIVTCYDAGGGEAMAYLVDPGSGDSSEIAALTLRGNGDLVAGAYSSAEGGSPALFELALDGDLLAQHPLGGSEIAFVVDLAANADSVAILGSEVVRRSSDLPVPDWTVEDFPPTFQLGHIILHPTGAVTVVGVDVVADTDPPTRRLAAASIDPAGEIDAIFEGPDYPAVDYVTDAALGTGGEVYALVTPEGGGTQVLRLVGEGAGPESAWSAVDAVRSGALSGDAHGFLHVVGDNQTQVWARRIAISPPQ
jgi:hypothetical protein